MKSTYILDLLADVERGELSAEAAADRLKSLPFEDLGHARVDHHRSLRTGLPEVIYSAGKSPEQTAAIFASLAGSGVDVLATRVDPARDSMLIENTPIDYLDFASPVAGLGSKLGLDATHKWPGETTREWGRPIKLDAQVERRVDALWSECFGRA